MKFAPYQGSSMVKQVNLLHLKIDTATENSRELFLNYDHKSKVLSLINTKNEAVVTLRKNDQINDGYWNKIEVVILANGFASIQLNDVFAQTSQYKVMESPGESFLSWHVGGNPSPNSHSDGFMGCVKDIQRNGVLISPSERLNATNGCPNPKVGVISGVLPQQTAFCGAHQVVIFSNAKYLL